MIRRAFPVLSLAALALVLAALWRISSGSLDISLAEFLAWLRQEPGLPLATAQILRLRLQRTLLLILVGAALACAGAVYQAALRNSLADPFILGVSAGAALASATTLSWRFSLPVLVGVAQEFSLARDLPLAAFAGAMLTLLCLHGIHRLGRDSMLTLVLGGVALNSFLSASLTLVMVYSRDMRGIYGWLLGSISEVSAAEPWTLTVTALVIGVSCLILFLRAPVLNLLLLDERVAVSLGLDTARERLALVSLASVAVAAAVAVSGMIGFVGLLVPHAARFLGGADHRLLLPFSFLLGGTVLCFCDALAQNLIGGMVIPAGVITSFIGAPFFILLLWRRR